MHDFVIESNLQGQYLYLVRDHAELRDVHVGGLDK